MLRDYRDRNRPILGDRCKRANGRPFTFATRVASGNDGDCALMRSAPIGSKNPGDAFAYNEGRRRRSPRHGRPVPLKEFASANGCSVHNDRADLVATLQKLKVRLVDGELVAMSCR
jgi:hypothetical protein